jgi:hypothetical protein
MSSATPDARRPRRANLAQFYSEQQQLALASASSASEKSATPSPNNLAKGDGGAKLKSKASVDEPPASNDPYDINSAAFDADAFTQKLIREATLTQLMSQEAEVVRQVGSLDSDMQTLVYENYNKFIAATDTIKKMRVDFRAMEDQMDQLAAKMQNICSFSCGVTATLSERRQRIADLSSTHALLKKLAFLFDLPAKLKECVDNDDLSTGVRYYLRAQRVLDQ